MKRILIFSHIYLPYIGGAEIAIKEITDRIDDIEFVMITGWRNKKHAKLERLGNITVHRVGLGYFQLDQYLYPLFAIFKALSLNHKKIFDMTWAMMPSQAGGAALLFKLLKPKIPYMLTDQSGDSDEFWKVRTFFWTPIFKKIFTKADSIQVISSFLAERTRKVGYTKQVHIIPNGVDIDRFSHEYSFSEKQTIKRKIDIKDEQNIVLTTSRLMHKNGIDTLIRAMSSLPKEYILLIIGWGDLENSLKELVKNLKLNNRVKFLGSIDNTEIPQYLSIADVFARPSRSEGQGISFLEAMLARVPVVAPAIGGIVDFLKNEETGLICKQEDPKDLAEKIIRAVEDQTLNNTITKNAYNLILEKYDWNVLSGQMKKLFMKTIKKSLQ